MNSETHDIISQQPVASHLILLLYEFGTDRKSTRLNSSHSQISYAVFCLKKKKDHEHTLHFESRHQNVQLAARHVMIITDASRVRSDPPAPSFASISDNCAADQ